MESDKGEIIGGEKNFWLYSKVNGFDLTHPATPSSQPIYPRIPLCTTKERIAIDPKKAALVVIDLQNYFLSPLLGRPKEGVGMDLVDRLVKHAIPACRRAGMPVIWLEWGLTQDGIDGMPPAIVKGFAVDTNFDGPRKIGHLGSEIGPLKHPRGTVIQGGRVLMCGEWNTATYSPLAEVAKPDDIWVSKNRLSGAKTDQFVGGSLQDAFTRGWDCLMLKDGEFTSVYTIMVLPLGRCSSSLRRGACTSSLALLRARQCLPRSFSQSSVVASKAAARPAREEILNAWDKYSNADVPLDYGSQGKQVGFLGKRRNVSKSLSFADLTTPSGEIIQICSDAGNDPDAHSLFRQIPANSPVLVDVQNEATDASREALNETSSKTTVYLKDIRALNSVPQNLIVTPEVQFPPTKRHFQIRFHPELQARLKFRSWLKAELNQGLLKKGFTDIETPTLFKSTPEGAREFLVPTRQRGMAYALNQSPQQYKQILMASGVSRYMQWARCYRDEDSRADRQPEFTQLDMEWSFAGAPRVRQDVNDIVLAALEALRPAYSYQDMRGERVPILTEIPDAPRTPDEPVAHEFTTLKFQDSIAAYGSDKPDLRIPNKIHALPDLEPYQQFVSMVTHLEDPLIEAFTFPLEGCSPQQAREFVIKFMDELPTALGENPDGKPQVLVCDSSKPLSGFSSLGFEFQNVLDLVSEGKEINDGDLVVFQAREKPKGQYYSGSTKIGEIRSALWKALVEAGYMTKPRLGDPGSLQFVWVTDFPMFKPTEEGEPGQEGAAGIAASHHPFTAPLSKADLELLFTDPLEAKSAAYDLVLNGVEVGGGSERIHIADVQEFIMRDILKMTDKRIGDFAHLFEALRSGCPPHAGFALGFDRLVALMTDTSTVRDVMAFPKTMKGEDPFVKSPSKLSNEQLAPYGLQLQPRGKRVAMAATLTNLTT
ncbi:hypothetical protein FDECE_75 [Fusarium decemcellulare]|nr:hypothetical protein FDECE_75 [Fusarium decemcellulare]